jgi:hypothetical protein
LGLYWVGFCGVSAPLKLFFFFSTSSSSVVSFSVINQFPHTYVHAHFPLFFLLFLSLLHLFMQFKFLFLICLCVLHVMLARVCVST